MEGKLIAKNQDDVIEQIKREFETGSKERDCNHRTESKNRAERGNKK